MKKLNLEQMEKVNGGCRHERLMRRYRRMEARGDARGMAKMYAKMMLEGCHY